MLASVMYWTGADMRSFGLEGLNAWLDAFDADERYLGTKGDYYTHIKDIPPQYGQVRASRRSEATSLRGSTPDNFKCKRNGSCY